MISPKTQVKIRTAVQDYFDMYPEDWELCKQEIEKQRQNLQTEMAELRGAGHAIQRALTSTPEKLFAMIQMKLDDEERMEFKEKENGRWFAREFPQFRITKEV